MNKDQMSLQYCILFETHSFTKTSSTATETKTKTRELQLQLNSM